MNTGDPGRDQSSSSLRVYRVTGSRSFWDLRSRQDKSPLDQVTESRVTIVRPGRVVVRRRRERRPQLVLTEQTG